MNSGKWKIPIGGTFFIALFFTLAALVFTLIVYITDGRYRGVFEAENGILELSPGDFQYNIPLIGEWRFFDSHLLTSTKDCSESYETIVVPHSWDETGYGTYGLQIEGLTAGEKYCLYIPDMVSAYAFYLNGKLIAANGQVGITRGLEKMHWEPLIVPFTASAPLTEISLQISNFHAFPGGFIREIKIGLHQNILREKERNLTIQLILFGGLLITGLYNISLFLLNTRDKAPFYFAVLDLSIAFRVLITGQRVINGWLISPNWYLFVKLQFLTGALTLGFFILFMNALFRERFNRNIIKVFLGAVGLLTLISLLLPMQNLAPADTVFLGISLTFILYLIITLIKAMRDNIVGSLFSFMGITFVLFSIILEFNMPPGNDLTPLGIFIFTIFQALVIAEKHSSLLEQNIELHKMAHCDGMTGLYKKEQFCKMVEEKIEIGITGVPHAMMFIDIDDFKSVNDGYGHDAGDKVLTSTARTLHDSLRHSDLASRYGGDEFILWLHSASRKTTEQVARRILLNLAKPVSFKEHEITISVSIGISYFPDDGTDFETLSRICDERMYIAKERGKNRFCCEG